MGAGCQEGVPDGVGCREGVWTVAWLSLDADDTAKPATPEGVIDLETTPTGAPINNPVTTQSTP